MTRVIPRELIRHLEWTPPEDRSEYEEGRDTNTQRSRRKHTHMTTKIAISAVCAVVAVAHLVFPQISIDLITLALLVAGIAPWLAPVVKSVEMPGGFKIELQDVKQATDKVSAGAVEGGVSAPSSGVAADRLQKEEAAVQQLRSISEQDPNLALVGLRIELEKRLASLAQEAGVSTEGRAAGWYLRELRRREALPAQLVSGLSDLIALGNRAAHGADVSGDAAAWALDLAPVVFSALDGYSAIPEQERVTGWHRRRDSR